MRFGWIAQHLAANSGGRIRYSLFRPWERYDAVVFLKSNSAECRALAARLRSQGTRVFFDINVDYFTPAEGTFYYQGMAPTEAQTADAHQMLEVADALIADSIHLQRVCEKHHPRVRWISDNVDFRIVPPYQPWKRDGKLGLLWSGEAVKLFELLRIDRVLRKFAAHIRLVLVTNELSALDRWFDPWKSRFGSLLGAVEHRIIPFQSVAALLRVYQQGGVFISPRFLDNTYNWGHTEWKITLPMACGRTVLASPLPSYQEVATRMSGPGLRLCDDDATWSTAFDEVLSVQRDWEREESAVRDVVQRHYSTPVVATAHAQFISETCAAGK